MTSAELAAPSVTNCAPPKDYILTTDQQYLRQIENLILINMGKDKRKERREAKKMEAAKEGQKRAEREAVQRAKQEMDTIKEGLETAACM